MIHWWALPLNPYLFSFWGSLLLFISSNDFLKAIEILQNIVVLFPYLIFFCKFFCPLSALQPFWFAASSTQNHIKTQFKIQWCMTEGCLQHLCFAMTLSLFRTGHMTLMEVKMNCAEQINIPWLKIRSKKTNYGRTMSLTLYHRLNKHQTPDPELSLKRSPTLNNVNNNTSITVL